MSYHLTTNDISNNAMVKEGIQNRSSIIATPILPRSSTIADIIMEVKKAECLY